MNVKMLGKDKKAIDCGQTFCGGSHSGSPVYMKMDKGNLKNALNRIEYDPELDVCVNLEDGTIHTFITTHAHLVKPKNGTIEFISED